MSSLGRKGFAETFCNVSFGTYDKGPSVSRAPWCCMRRAPALFAALLRRAGVAPALLPLLAEPAWAAVQGLGILARRRHPGHTAAFLVSLREICAGTSCDAQLVGILSLYLMWKHIGQSGVNDRNGRCLLGSISRGRGLPQCYKSRMFFMA